MKLKTRRLSVVVCAAIGVVIWLLVNPASYEQIFTPVENTGAESGIDGVGDYAAEAVTEADASARLAVEVLGELEVKGRAPKTGYDREQFYGNWPTVDGCNLRQRIIRREFGESAVLDGCNVVAGEYDEPYTGEHKVFSTREEISKGVQIDHVVALSDAWQKGAQYMDYAVRNAMATDPLNLLAVDASANGKKSDGDAATWLPPNKKFRCQYVARQVSVKYKYGLWVTEAEKEAILRVLENCPIEPAVGV
ncbi:HNH endonuclease [Candidatus Saccharibacteria bacterium]|nr:HNH endonuclease [Candidatus Saccharibacteria bacterium]